MTEYAFYIYYFYRHTPPQKPFFISEASAFPLALDHVSSDYGKLKFEKGIYTNDNDDGKSKDREKTESITRWLDTSDHSDQLETFLKVRQSDASKE